jgi:hypothetical protein
MRCYFTPGFGLILCWASACGGETATYCSASRGPLTASQAHGVSDVTLCPPPGESNGRCEMASPEAGTTSLAGGECALGAPCAPVGPWWCAVQTGSSSGH